MELVLPIYNTHCLFFPQNFGQTIAHYTWTNIKIKLVSCAHRALPTANMWGLFFILSSSPTLWTPTGCPTIEFWHWPQVAHTPQVKGSAPQAASPAQMEVPSPRL